MITRANLNPDKYHRLPFQRAKLPDLEKCGYISASLLSKARDPLMLMTAPEDDSTKATEWGSLVDCLWLTPTQFKNLYVELPDDAPQRPTAAMLKAKKPSAESVERQNWWAAFDAQAQGKEPVTAEMLREARRAIGMLNQHPRAKEIHEASEKQVALVGKSQHRGQTIQVKALIDLRPAGHVADLKTTHDMSDRGIANTMVSFEYALKMSWYRRMLREAGEDAEKAFLIWQRSSYPYDVKVRELCENDLDLMDHVAMKRLDTLASINPNDLTSLYDTQVRISRLPEWAVNQYIIESEAAKNPQ